MKEVKNIVSFFRLFMPFLLAMLLAGCSVIDIPFYNDDSENIDISMLSEAQQKQYELSLNYIDSAHYDIAESKLLSIIEEYPNFSEAHNALGVLYERRGRVSEGSEAFYTAMALNPDYTVAINNYSDLKCYTKGPEGIKEDNNRVKNARLKSRLYSAASKCYISKNNFSDGEEMANNAVELDAKYAVSYLYLAKIQNHNKQYELAKVSIDQFNDLNGYTKESANLGYVINQALMNKDEMQKYQYVLATQFNEKM